mgnify:CR=1 FL=1
MKFLKYNMKNILSVCCMGLMLLVGTTSIRCHIWTENGPIFTDDEEFNKYMEEKHRQEGYTTYSSMDEKNATQNGGNSNIQNEAAPSTEAKEQTFEFRPVGYGVQDFEAILKASEKAGASWVVVEQDQPSLGKTPMECAKMSIDYIKSL